jgi:hypothetical protein
MEILKKLFEAFDTIISGIPEPARTKCKSALAECKKEVHPDLSNIFCFPKGDEVWILLGSSGYYFKVQPNKCIELAYCSFYSQRYYRGDCVIPLTQSLSTATIDAFKRFFTEAEVLRQKLESTQKQLQSGGEGVRTLQTLFAALDTVIASIDNEQIFVPVKLELELCKKGALRFPEKITWFSKEGKLWIHVKNSGYSFFVQPQQKTLQYYRDYQFGRPPRFEIRDSNLISLQGQVSVKPELIDQVFKAAEAFQKIQPVTNRESVIIKSFLDALNTLINSITDQETQVKCQTHLNKCYPYLTNPTFSSTPTSDILISLDGRKSRTDFIVNKGRNYIKYQPRGAIDNGFQISDQVLTGIGITEQRLVNTELINKVFETADALSKAPKTRGTQTEALTTDVKKLEVHS